MFLQCWGIEPKAEQTLDRGTIASGVEIFNEIFQILSHRVFEPWCVGSTGQVSGESHFRRFIARRGSCVGQQHSSRIFYPGDRQHLEIRKQECVLILWL